MLGRVPGKQVVKWFTYKLTNSSIISIEHWNVINLKTIN